jgi:hypothetical protein
MAETFDVESLGGDTMFKKAFRRPNIFTGLVEDFTGVHVEINEVELKHKMFFIFTSDPHNDLDVPKAGLEWIEAINETISGKVFVENDYTNPLIHEMFKIISVENTTPEEKVKMQAEVTQEALDKAKKEGQYEAILKLKQSGCLSDEISDEMIAEILDLPIEEVQESVTIV